MDTSLTLHRARRDRHRRHPHHNHRPTCVHTGIHAGNCPLIPKSHYIILSSCVYSHFFLKKKKNSGGLCVLMYHFFIAKTSQRAISLESTADIQYRGFFSPSLKQYEHSFCSSERSHPLNMGRSPHCVCVCAGVHVSVNALESFQSWVDVLGVVLSHTNSCVTSSFLSLRRRHGDSDGNAGKL